MFTQLYKLCKSFPFSQKILPEGEIFLIINTIQSEADFFSSYLLKYFLKQKSEVIFVSSKQNYAHYLKLSKRLGANLNKYISNSSLHYIDCFSPQGSQWQEDEIPLTEETTNLWVQTLPKMSIIELTGELPSLKELFDTIKQKSKEMKQKLGCLIIDSLSTYFLQYQLKDIISFVLSLINLAKQEEKSLFVMITKDILSQDERKLLKIIQLHSFLTFDIFENQSGYSKEIKGQFKLVFTKSGEEFQYKYNLEEYKLRIFEYLESK